MAYPLRVAFALLCFSGLLLCVHGQTTTNSTGTSNVPAVVLDNEAAFAVCVYPTSASLSPCQTDRLEVKLTVIGSILVPESHSLLLRSRVFSFLKGASVACRRGSCCCADLFRCRCGTLAHDTHLGFSRGTLICCRCMRVSWFGEDRILTSRTTLGFCTPFSTQHA